MRARVVLYAVPLCFWQVLLEEELQQLEQKRRDLKKDGLIELQHA